MAPLLAIRAQWSHVNRHTDNFAWIAEESAA
jgi:hypothetical protein